MKTRPRIVVHNHFKARDTGSLEEASNEVKRLYRELKATTEGAPAYRELKKRYEAALKHEEAMVQGAGRGFGQKVGGRDVRMTYLVQATYTDASGKIVTKDVHIVANDPNDARRGALATELPYEARSGKITVNGKPVSRDGVATSAAARCLKRAGSENR